MLQGIYKHTPVEYQSNLSITYREAFIYKFRSHNDLYTEIDIYTPVYIKHAAQRTEPSSRKSRAVHPV